MRANEFRNVRLSLGRRFSGAILLLLAVMVSCTQMSTTGGGPKERLNQYISLSFAVSGVSDKTKLADFLTGDSKTRLEKWSDEQFLNAFKDSNRKFVRLAFKEEKAVSETESLITYELTYTAPGKSGPVKTTQKKVAQLLKQGPNWFIGEVKSLNELVEYTDELSLP